jgi:hypothetical protein
MCCREIAPFGEKMTIRSIPNGPPLPLDDIARARCHQISEEDSADSSQPSDGEKFRLTEERSHGTKKKSVGEQRPIAKQERFADFINESEKAK